jgi:hypothetical protein
MEEAAIQFYKVTRCGYYEYWSPDAEFGNLRGTLSTLDDWANKDDMVLRHTGIYEPDEGSNIDPVYCYDVRHSEESGNYLLLTGTRHRTRMSSFQARRATHLSGTSTSR